MPEDSEVTYPPPPVRLFSAVKASVLAPEKKPVLLPLQPIHQPNILETASLPPYACSLPKRQSIITKLGSDGFASGNKANSRKMTSQPPEWLAKALRVSSLRTSPSRSYAQTGRR